MRKELSERLGIVKKHVDDGAYTVMIIGLGSVGCFLLDYLMSAGDEALQIVVVGRSREKMEESVNIVRVSALIRGQARSRVSIEDGVDLDDISAIRAVIDKCQPDFIVNSSRAYSGLKYGIISWTNFRAYGIWAPLAIRFTKNIMQACDEVSSDAIVINTSYSDAVIPWLKSTGRAYPDFGSGNFNHLVPRIRYAVSELLGVTDYWNVDVVFAAGHFHDVVISKEGHTEGVDLPLKIWYKGEEIGLTDEAEPGSGEGVDGGTSEGTRSGSANDERASFNDRVLSKTEIFHRCAIAMPTDARRNQMNASSNYRIIRGVVDVMRGLPGVRLFIPGAFGEIGGYPVCVSERSARIDESVISFEEMNRTNRRSMYLDGIEDVRDGCLFYTDELIEKVRDKFGTELPKTVHFDEIDKVAAFLIEDVIHKAGK